MSTVTGYRISPQQAALWQCSQRQNTPEQVNWLQIEVNQVPDESVLRDRLFELTAKEEILRTRLHALPGMALPIQVIEETAEVALDIEDWRDLSFEKKSIEERDRVVRERISFLQGKPLHVWLAQTDMLRWVFLLKASASHLDLASLWRLAQALLNDTVVEERLQYADYAEWKHGLLEEEQDNAGFAFWRQQRQEMTTPLLPGLQHIPLTPSCDMSIASLDVDVDTLQQRSSSLGISPEEYLFCAWSILLGRLRGQSQLQLSWIDDGRGEELENALGSFEQALPVQISIDLASSLRDQQTSILHSLRLARGWRDYYDSSQTCEAFFAYRRFIAENANSALVNSAAIDARYSVGLDCVFVNNVGLGKTIPLSTNQTHLQCRLVYDRTNFSDTAIACLREQWQKLLHGLANPDIPVGAIGLQGERQTRCLTPLPAPNIEPVSVLEMIERQVHARPDASALADNSGVLCYRELSARSNQLAWHLQATGVKPGDIVGILLPRGNSMIVAILAVLKAGGAYLPLDPGYPADRLAYLVQDSGVQIVVSLQEHRHALPVGVRGLLLDDSVVPWASLPELNLNVIQDLNQPAYLIYTSGSTGLPKAVEITHANLSHSTQVRMAFYQNPVTAYLLLSSFAFDSSVAGIFWTLAQGGLLVLPASGEELDLATLSALIKRHNISHSLSLPSLYETLLDYAERDVFASLSTWIVAGEACAPQVVTKHQQKAPHANLVNEYGPTEATVWATADVLTDARDISIGRPIPTMELWLLNEQGVPAAIGEPGEIHLGGPTLSPGYRHRPEQTAQAFLNSADIANGARRYRTGDLARWRLDGRLDFLGRADHQVKIRGYRVELGEIERILMQHSEVRDAVVIAQDLPNGKRLVAYVTDRLGYAPAVQALNNYLSDRLPSYMVPGAFVHMKEFPRTPNGKLDLKALPSPEHASASQVEYVAPRNELETELAAICAAVLRRDKVGVHDNFFQNGGDSILSLQIVARANQRGIRLTAKQVFESETIERMAKVAIQFERDAALMVSDARCSDSLHSLNADASNTNFSNNALDLSLAGLDADGFQDLLAELETVG